jgi:hypothetical protein
MDWKREAKAELRDLPQMREALVSIPERIAYIEAKKTSLQSSSDSTPVQGGGSSHEDRLLNLIVEEERLKLTLKAHKIRLKLIERGLEAVTEDDRLILTTFAEHRSAEAVDILTAKLFLERSRVYQLWDAALKRYTVAEFGLVDF